MLEDKREYRYHYIKIDNEELEDSIISYMETYKYEESEENKIFGDLLYATNNSLTGESGDSYYNPDFKDKVKFLSETFPKVTFTAGWTNNEDKKDKGEFIYKNGNKI